ncbi:MAG: hypothetical protein JWR09_4239 [Mucilaginibacter sp.]|nr:hypothetical protein [Mucilaginibacter sp.]
MKTKKLLLGAFLFSPFCCFAETAQDHPTNAETWIAFLPVIFFFLILLITTVKLRNNKVSLADLLEEKDPATPPAAGQAPVATPAQQSVSRFIAFLTGLVALTIGVCITTFYMYSYFSNPSQKIDISNLTSVIWGLGIGVLPYGFNKASSAIKPNS